MRKVITALFTTALGLAALLSFKTHSAAPALAAAGPAAASSPARTTATPATPATGGTSAIYTGTPADTSYGPVQVKITVTAGKITDLTVLQVPDNGGYEQQIVTQALPILKSEALTAQNARIDTVSGATYTSQGYAQSLQSALDQAHL
jgi:uncharacterized protein with FMN-binding domain